MRDALLVWCRPVELGIPELEFERLCGCRELLTVKAEGVKPSVGATGLLESLSWVPPKTAVFIAPGLSRPQHVRLEGAQRKITSFLNQTHCKRGELEVLMELNESRQFTNE